MTQYNSSLSSFVPNFRILTQVVAEKSLTEKKVYRQTDRQTDKQTNIITEKAKTIYPYILRTRGYNNTFYIVHIKINTYKNTYQDPFLLSERLKGCLPYHNYSSLDPPYYSEGPKVIPMTFFDFHFHVKKIFWPTYSCAACITCDPSIYTMDHPDLTDLNFMGNSIGPKRDTVQNSLVMHCWTNKSLKLAT